MVEKRMDLSRRSLFKFGAALLASAAIPLSAAPQQPTSKIKVVTPDGTIAFFNAWGDGENCDAENLTRAMAFATVNGGTVEIGPGMYNVGGGLHIDGGWTNKPVTVNVIGSPGGTHLTGTPRQGVGVWMDALPGWELAA